MAGFLADLSNGSGAGAGASGSAQGLPGLSPEACRLAWSAPAVDSLYSFAAAWLSCKSHSSYDSNTHKTHHTVQAE